ncbi:MAG: DinB family protein [Chloroflexi bacterium]|nr:DinB family protein [Chloroflexota bacterium]
MHPFFADYLERLTTLHRDIERAISGLTPAALDWTPAPDTNSITVLVTHTAGAERYWIGDLAAQMSSSRDREAEFHTKGLNEAALKQRLAQADDFARQALDGLTLADLDTERRSPRNERTFTVSWALLHALEHTALHLGHIQLTRQLWEQESEGE